jgi:hypothetical protein
VIAITGQTETLYWLPHFWGGPQLCPNVNTQMGKKVLRTLSKISLKVLNYFCKIGLRTFSKKSLKVFGVSDQTPYPDQVYILL